jgi:hypothetical protein
MKGYAWNIQTIRKAMMITDPKKRLQLQPIVNGGCLALVKECASDFLIHGTLNRSYRINSATFCHAEEDGVATTEEDWQHTVAIRGKKLMCMGLLDEHAYATSLRLTQKTGAPHKNGYMQKLTAVYKVITMK